jgi:tetratricopeptide (TPR) repeat protein
MLASPSKRDAAGDLAKRAVPKAIAQQILAEAFSARAPKPKQKAFLAKIKNLLSPEAAHRLALEIDPPRRPRTKTKTKPPPPVSPAWDGSALWQTVSEAAAGREENPVALYHLAIRKAEGGKASEALADLERVASLKPDDARVTAARAGVSLEAGDTVAATGLYDSLSRVESPEWQAKGFRASARLAWRSGRGEATEKALWRAMGLDGRSAEARGDLMFLARVSLTRDTWKPVEALLDSLVKLRPREAEGYYWLGEMALKREQDGVALERFQQAVRLAPKRVEFAEALAAAYFTREECDAALKALQPVRARLGAGGLAVFGKCLLAQGRAAEAVTGLGKLYSARPSADNLAAYARALTAAKRADQATALIASSPYAGDFEVRKAGAEAYLALDSMDRAKGLLDPPPAGHETDPEALYLLGRAEYAARAYDAAGKRLTAALQYRADYPEAKYLQGLCLLKQGRSGEAHFYFKELTDSEKPSWRAKGLLGQGQAFAKEEKPEAAEENLRRSFQAAPGAEAAAHLALVLLKADKAQEAAEWAAKARKLDPNEPLGLMAAVDGLIAGDRLDEAVALAQSGLDKHPASCDFLVVAAKAQLRAGHDAEAGDLSRRASARCPEESAPYFFLGTLSAKAGSTQDARRLFAEYLRAGGDAKRVPAAYR